MATHSRVLAWRIPGMVEPGGLPSMGSHRVRHNWSDLAAAAAAAAVFYVDDLIGRKRSGREGLRCSGSSRSALNSFILEMSFRLLSGDVTFQDVTKKACSGGWLGFSLSILDQILHLNSRNTTNSPRHTLGSDRLRLAPVRHFLSHLPSVPPSLLLLLFSLFPFLMVFIELAFLWIPSNRNEKPNDLMALFVLSYLNSLGVAMLDKRPWMV